MKAQVQSKAYSFNVAPCVAAMLPNYDTIKIGNAVESHGNDNLTVVDVTDRSANGYKAEKVSASGKVSESSSNATVTKRVKLEGDGSPHRMFAAWHDDTVKMIGKYGSLVGCPLPVVLRTWLDAKFHKGAKSNGAPTVKAIKRNVTPSGASALVSNGEHKPTTV